MPIQFGHSNTFSLIRERFSNRMAALQTFAPCSTCMRPREAATRASTRMNRCSRAQLRKAQIKRSICPITVSSRNASPAPYFMVQSYPQDYPVPANGEARIKVIGVGGGGGNALNRMIEADLQVRASTSMVGCDAGIEMAACTCTFCFVQRCQILRDLHACRFPAKSPPTDLLSHVSTNCRALSSGRSTQMHRRWLTTVLPTSCRLATRYVGFGEHQLFLTRCSSCCAAMQTRHMLSGMHFLTLCLLARRQHLGPTMPSQTGASSDFFCMYVTPLLLLDMRSGHKGSWLRWQP